MIDFTFTEEQEMFRKAARDFAEEMVAPHVAQMEETGKVSDEVVKAMAEAEMMALTIPEEYGGLGLGYTARLIAVEEVARVSVAAAMMLHPAVKPVRMTRGRSLVAFSCYEYRNVLGVAPYNEIAMTIPVLVDPGISVPVLPMIWDGFENFGYHVFSMPVTSLENQLRGLRIWGLPKVVQRIDIDVVDGSHSPGTGAPVFTGITSTEFLEIMDAMRRYDIITAVDLCEVAPPLDPTGRTVHLAAGGLLRLLTTRLLDKVDID